MSLQRPHSAVASWAVPFVAFLLTVATPHAAYTQRLHATDSTRLQEDGARFVAAAAGLVVARDGAIFVSDNSNKFVLGYARDGRLLRQFGRRGNGPGELASAVQLALDGDSLLLVNNLSRLRIEAYDVRTGVHRWGTPLPRRTFSLTSDGGLIRAAGIAMGEKASLLEVRASNGKSTAFGPLPELIEKFPILGGPFGTVLHDARGDRIAALFEVSDYVYVWQRDRTAVDSILIPRIRRRGARRDLLQAAGRDTARGRDALFKSSIPVAVGWLSDSSIAVVHGDVDLRGQLFEGNFFVSVINTRTRTSCADIPLSMPGDPFPRFAFQRGLLHAVVQHVPDEGVASSYVVRYAIGATCAARRR